MKYGTDYTKSAINLVNPNEVKNLLLQWEKANNIYKANIDALNKTAEAIEVQAAQVSVERLQKELRAAIDRAGSYQDIAEGLYALKQARKSTSYDPKQVRKHIPQFAEAVITETVDGNKIRGLQKGGLIDENQLRLIEITMELEPAYIVGVAYKPKEGTDE